MRTFFAVLSFSSLPPEVIHKKPPYNTRMTAMMPKKLKATLIIPARITLISVVGRARVDSNSAGAIEGACANAGATKKSPKKSHRLATVIIFEMRNLGYGMETKMR